MRQVPAGGVCGERPSGGGAGQRAIVDRGTPLTSTVRTPAASRVGAS